MLLLQINSSQHRGSGLAGARQEMLLLGQSRARTEGKV